MHYNGFDYFAWWKNAVKEHGISPSEAWKLDYKELSILNDVEAKSTQDGSFMINAQRKINGMTDSEVLNGN